MTSSRNHTGQRPSRWHRIGLGLIGLAAFIFATSLAPSHGGAQTAAPAPTVQPPAPPTPPNPPAPTTKTSPTTPPAAQAPTTQSAKPADGKGCFRWGWRGWGRYKDCAAQKDECVKCQRHWGSKNCWRIC